MRVTSSGRSWQLSKNEVDVYIIDMMHIDNYPVLAAVAQLHVAAEHLSSHPSQRSVFLTPSSFV
jgi:hypothetical protein